MDSAVSALPRTRDDGETASPDAFGQAIDEFLAELGEKNQEESQNPFLQVLLNQSGIKRAENGSSQSEVSAQELQDALLDLDARQRDKKGYRLLHRLSPFLEILKNVLRKGEALTQAAPLGVSIAFVGARIVLEMALSVEEYLEVVVNAMERVGLILEVYQRLSPTPDLASLLVRSHKKIIKFWYKLSKVLSSTKVKGIFVRSILTPLKKETEEGLKDLQEDMHINLGVSQAAGLQKAEADRREKVDAEQIALKDSIRQWIMGQDAVDFKGDYETQLDLRHSDTCAWLFQDQRFVDWRDSRQNSLLWYNAQPGSGKSVLASVMIDHLIRAEKKVAYFFYSFSRRSNRHVVDGLRTLALQLLAFAHTPSDKLVDLYKTDVQFSNHLYNIRTIVDVVHELITRNNDLYIVIDGIDECEDEKEMLGLLEMLIARPTLGTAKWLFTSRVSEIEKSMRKLLAVEIRPRPESIREDIKNYLSPIINCCNGRLDGWTDECDNNFLIARFVAETLGKLTSEADIEEELSMFPKKLNGYYLRTLAKLNTRGHMEQLAARRIFLILCTAQQTLTSDELVDALAVRRGSTDYSASRVPKKELIHDLCGSLITIEDQTLESSQSPVVRFCHKSVKDFFQQDPKNSDTGIDESLHKYFVSPSEANEELGLDCLTYLMYGRYSKHIDLGFLSDAEILKEHALLRYAATFWFQHLGDDTVGEPSAAVVLAVREFIGSKNFWNCLQVQGRVVPYLFGRYTRYKWAFKMAFRGQGCKGRDNFAVPLPIWLSDCSPDDLLKDQSLCHFVQEWRQVIIAHPDGIDQCVSMKPFASSCWLKSLYKGNKVKAANLADAFNSDTLTACQILDVSFRGKKLCVDVAYRTRDDPVDVIHRLKQALFKANSEPQKSCEKLPVTTDSSEWMIRPLVSGDATTELVGWSVDPTCLDLKRLSYEHSERAKPPTRLNDAVPNDHTTRWVMIAQHNSAGTDGERCVDVIHMSRKSIGRTKRNYEFDDREWNDDDLKGSVAASAGEATDSDDDENEFSDDDDDDDDYDVDNGGEEDDDDDSSSEDSGDETAPEEMSTDDSDLDSEIGVEKAETDCLILIPRDRQYSPYWTMPWTHPPFIWSKTTPAMHPTKPLAVYMHTPTQLEVVDLEGGTQLSVSVSGLADEPDNVLARAQELRFSKCGKYIHRLHIAFVQKSHCYVECSVALSLLENKLDTADTITASETCRVVHCFAGKLRNTDAPFMLSYWCNNYVIVALSPLTCKPKILRIALDRGVVSPVSTLRNAIYFPESTPRRDAQLLYRQSTKDSEEYLFLVLNAVLSTESENCMSSPVIALRWGISDDNKDNGWRSWNDEMDGGDPASFLNNSPDWHLMRGCFAESGKPFSVPIRSGLNWTRKGYLSCG